MPVAEAAGLFWTRHNLADHDDVSSGTPTMAVTAANGTSPPAPVLVAGSTDSRGKITFGSGSSGGLAAGAQVTVTLGTPTATAPGSVNFTAANAATAALTPYVGTVNATSFQIATLIPTASQANTVYAVYYEVIQ